MKINRSVCFISAVGLLASALAFTKAFAGSPFYLTVEKSFSSSEKPEVRLDYADSSKPLSVRVLRPKSLERFLDGQLHISRSYEQPVSELNPGHYFVKGLNKVESPLKSFREMLDGDFRKSFHDTSFNKAIRDTAKGDLASTPEEVIQRPPAELTVVRELFVDLQFGGASANDLGWWLAGNTWEEDRYKIRKITLDPLPDGVYLIQAVQGKTEAQCLMQVSSLAVQVKQEIGRRYAGDKIRISAMRGTERIERDVELVDRLEPYQHPFLGILPMRPSSPEGKGPAAGVKVRYVYPGGPAAKAGVQPGDLLVSAGGGPVGDLAQLRSRLIELQPGDALLIAGKGHETYQIIGDKTLPFDDRAMAEAMLRRGHEAKRDSKDNGR